MIFRILILSLTLVSFSSASSLSRQQTSQETFAQVSIQRNTIEVTEAELRKRLKYTPSVIHPAGVPLNSRKRREVILSLRVDKEGRVVGAKVLEGSWGPYGSVARNIALRSTFEPYVKNSKKYFMRGVFKVMWEDESKHAEQDQIENETD